jgi:hypothetical protein
MTMMTEMTATRSEHGKPTLHFLSRSINSNNTVALGPR